jgi:hypothetical protein
MDLVRLPGVDYAATVFPGTHAPPAAEPAATDKPVSSGVAEVEAAPEMAPYADVGQGRRPANNAAQEALIPVADLCDSASSGADNPVGSDPSSAEPELQGPITSPAQLSASPADPAAPAQKPLTVAGDIQPAAPQQPGAIPLQGDEPDGFTSALEAYAGVLKSVIANMRAEQPASNAPVPAAPGTPRALADGSGQLEIDFSRMDSILDRWSDNPAGKEAQFKAEVFDTVNKVGGSDPGARSQVLGAICTRYENDERVKADLGLWRAQVRENAAGRTVKEAEGEVWKARKKAQDARESNDHDGFVSAMEKLKDSTQNYIKAVTAHKEAQYVVALAAASRANVVALAAGSPAKDLALDPQLRYLSAHLRDAALGLDKEVNAFMQLDANLLKAYNGW